MPISALVATLADDPAAASHALAALERDPRITIGRRLGLRLPLVSDTASAEEGEALFEHIRTTDGIRFLDVVMVDFSADEGAR